MAAEAPASRMASAGAAGAAGGVCRTRCRPEVASADFVAFTDVDCPRTRTGLNGGWPGFRRHRVWPAGSSSSCRALLDAGVGGRGSFGSDGTSRRASRSRPPFRRQASVRRAGRLDERLKSGGDYEFGLRCSLAGIPIRYADDVVVSHPARTTLRELLSKSERVGFGTGQLIRRRGISRERLAAVLPIDSRWRDSAGPPNGRSRSRIAGGGSLVRGVHLSYCLPQWPVDQRLSLPGPSNPRMDPIIEERFRRRFQVTR